MLWWTGGTLLPNFFSRFHLTSTHPARKIQLVAYRLDSGAWCHYFRYDIALGLPPEVILFLDLVSLQELLCLQPLISGPTCYFFNTVASPNKHLYHLPLLPILTSSVL